MSLINRITKIEYRYSSSGSWVKLPVNIATIEESVGRDENGVQTKEVLFSLRFGEDFDFGNVGLVRLTYLDKSIEYMGTENSPVSISSEIGYATRVKMSARLSFVNILM